VATNTESSRVQPTRCVFGPTRRWARLNLRITIENPEDLQRATGIESAPPAWEAEFSILYFQHYKIAQKKCACMRLHTVHALPDLRVAAGRLRDGVSLSFAAPMARGPVCSYLFLVACHSDSTDGGRSCEFLSKLTSCQISSSDSMLPHAGMPVFLMPCLMVQKSCDSV